MKQLATIGAVVVMLLGAALYFGSQNTDTPQPQPTPDPDPVQPAPDQPIMSAKSDGTLILKAAMSNGYISTAAQQDIFASIDIDAIKHEGSKRPPLNLALVIDRSGSMAGQKIENAKLAARRLVNVLEDHDRVAIVSYGSDVSVDFASARLDANNRVILMRAINSVAIGGGTNLSGGFQQGFSEVSRNKTGETVNRVILMSDGHANVGMTSMPQLTRLATTALSSDVSVTTMGVGLDYNEDIMTAMANEGAGNYHFIDQPSTIAGIFEAELEGLASTVAKNAAVAVKLAPGVTLDKLFGFAHTVAGNQVIVSLAEFHSEETKSILMKLKANAGAEGTRPIVDVNLSYQDVVNEKPAHASVALKSIATSDASLAQTKVNVDVIARVQQVEVAETLNEAMSLYEEGKAEEASQRIEETQRVMKKRRKSYQFQDDAAFGRADQELDDVKREVRARPAASAEGRRLRKEKKAKSNVIMLDSNSFY